MTKDIEKFNYSLPNRTAGELYNGLEILITDPHLNNPTACLITFSMAQMLSHPAKQKISTEFANRLIDKVRLHDEDHSITSKMTIVKQAAYRTMEEIEKNTGIPIGEDRKKRLLAEVKKETLEGQADAAKERINKQADIALEEIKFLDVGRKEFHRLNGDINNPNIYNEDALRMLGRPISQPSADIELTERAKSEGIPIAATGKF